MELGGNHLEAPGDRDDKAALARGLLETSIDCIKLMEPNGNILFVNEAGVSLLEAECAEALIGKTWVDLWPEDSRARARSALEDAALGATTCFTASCPSLKGVLKWWDVTVAPVRDRDGRVNQIMATSRDISKQKALAELLETSAVKFRALANSISQLAWMADASGNVYWYNDRWFDYTGTTLEEMRGWGWRAAHDPLHVDRVVQKITECFQSGEPWEDTFPLRGKDGRYRWFLSRANPVRDNEGKIAVWCGTNTDITEELAARQRLERKARLIDLSHEAILVRDHEDKIDLWNSGCEDLFGYSREEAVGARCDELLRTEFPRGKAEIEKALKEHGRWNGELMHRARDGSPVWVESRQQALCSGENTVIIECDRDTRERRANDEIRNLLIGELSHRVKNSLAIVQAFAAQTGRRATSVGQFLRDFGGRIDAMSAAHNLLDDTEWSGANLRALIESQTIEQFGSDRSVSIHGDSVVLSARTAFQLALILHELATNAQKHGALSDPNGRLDIGWENSREDNDNVEIVWRESGGPVVRAPKGRGFGLLLLDRSRNTNFLTVDIAFEPAGVVCKMRVDQLVAGAAAPLFKFASTPRGA